MIQILCNEPTTPEWQAWRTLCQQEQQDLITAVQAWLVKWANAPAPHDEKQKQKEKPAVNPDVYKGQKEEFYMHPNGPFHGKCAYCESRFYTTSAGDVEHYRPKGSLRAYPAGAAIEVTLNGVQVPHPGYYWLAYDWQNLMPACDFCNRPTKFRSAGRKIGKHDFFPLEPAAVYAAQPGEELQEHPLLLNPLLENPEDHLLLDETGVLAAKTPRGQMCIDLLGLNDRDLPNERKEVYKDVLLKFKELAAAKVKAPLSAETASLVAEMQAIKEGSRPYTMAARLAIEQGKKNLAEFLNNF